MVSLAVWHLQVRARQEVGASTGGYSFANCLHIGEPCFAIGSDWEHDCLWSRESQKGHLKADFWTSYIIAEHIVFSYHFCILVITPKALGETSPSILNKENKRILQEYEHTAGISTYHILKLCQECHLDP